ncbi:hypothetical protein BH11ACT8_BH11ACT8_04900 [soil metagenome]
MEQTGAADDDTGAQTPQSRRRAALMRSRPHGLRLLACLVVAAVLGAPLAVSWAITHTEVRDTIGTSPTTFSLSTRGNSELRLGIAGTVYLPESTGPIGVVATVEGPGDPGAGDGDLANYVRPEMLELYAGLFHDPQAAIDEYVRLIEDELRHQVIVSELVVTGLGGGLLFAFSYLLPWRPGIRRRTGRVVLAGAVVLATSAGLGYGQLETSTAGRGPTAGTYDLPVLDGTLAAGATTNSPVIRALAGGALSKSMVLVRRQEAREVAYRTQAGADLQAQVALMEAPREGETSVIMQSDMHCNTSMIRLQKQVVALLKQQHGDGVPALMAITGDLTTNGTGAEGTCIRDEAAIAGDTPVAAVIGNHESDISSTQMSDAGMHVLTGDIEDLGGFRVLGDGDPNRSELFGATMPRGDETQEGLGRRLRQVAADQGSDNRPDLVLVHEAYAAAAFLGIEDMNTFMQNPDATTLTDPVEDGVDDVPASAIFYGHWHRSIDPRVVWNSDGSWTLVMELDTSGGAIDSPTINKFSTPWSRPQQEASFPVLFLDEETRMITGYQLYRFATDGTATVLPRVDVGIPPDTSTTPEIPQIGPIVEPER